MNYHIYNIKAKNDGSREIIFTVIFDSRVALDTKVFIQEYKLFLLDSTPSEVLIYIKPYGFVRDDLITYLTSIKPIILLEYDDNGIRESNISLETIDLIKEYGLMEIFRKHNGILQSEKSYHYILPSGKHSKYFIRVGNTLSMYPHVNFYAIWILKYVKKDVKKIYYDSSSILSILTALFSIKKYFDPDFYIELENFSSYSGLSNTDFADNSLVVISASNSGDIARKIAKLNSDKKITFLFIVLNVENPEHDFVLNLFNKDPYLKQKQFTVDCDYCSHSSTPVVISGEQFLPSKTKIRDLVFFKKDISKESIDFLKEVVGKKVIKCNYPDKGDKNRELFIDLQEYYKAFDIATCKKEESDFFATLKEYIDKITLNRKLFLLCLNDVDSILLASKIKQYLISSRGITPDLFVYNVAALDIPLDTNGDIIIIASSIVSGNNFYKISTELRKYSNCSLYYLTCVARTINEEKNVFLKSNIEYRKDKKEKNEYISLLSISIPNNHSRSPQKIFNTPWEVEKDFLFKLISNDSSCPIFIKERFDQLFDLQINDLLFWYNPLLANKERLKIRNNFAFFKFEDYVVNINNDVLQSELYFIVLSIIHNVRNRDDNNTQVKLEQHEHVRTLISPKNFSRYNDGVIQASILRAARAAELDYSIADEISSEALNVLTTIFDGVDKVNAECIIEFLYCIAIKKLSLNKDHLILLIKLIDSQYSNIEEVMYFVNYIKKNFLESEISSNLAEVIEDNSIFNWRNWQAKIIRYLQFIKI